MQNYLHSACAPIRGKRVFVIAVCGVLISVLILAICLNSHGYENGGYRGVMGADIGDNTHYFLKNDDEKMNNELLQVAKNDENAVHDRVKDTNVVRVLMKDGTGREMELEEYVKGCVLGEMPLSFESQALMAQSVAVRTFTLRCMTGKSKHKNADVCTNPACCQSFVDEENKNINEENKKKLHDAVSATRGIVMVYDGLPINAVYHASSGEKTLSSEQVWGGRVDYLVSVDAPNGEKEIYENGYGHRVGMSQHGANLLAAEGMNYMEILRYYYRGICFDFV